MGKTREDTTVFPRLAHLSESGHGLAGDDLIVVEPREEAQSLVLVLPSLQLPQDQRTEYLHILQHTHTHTHTHTH